MLKRAVTGVVLGLALTACQPKPDSPPPPVRTLIRPAPERQFIKDYDDRRPIQDQSTDADVLKLGRLMCKKLAEDVHPDDLVKTLAFDSAGKPTGMSLAHAAQLLGSAVANLCPDQKDKLNG